MPIYTYRCLKCKAKFDELVGTLQNYPEPVNCAVCGNSAIEKVISTFSVKLPFYATKEGEEDAVKNKAWLESVGDEIKSGARTMTMPKNYPARLQPKL